MNYSTNCLTIIYRKRIASRCIIYEQYQSACMTYASQYIVVRFPFPACLRVRIQYTLEQSSRFKIYFIFLISLYLYHLYG